MAITTPTSRSSSSSSNYDANNNTAECIISSASDDADYNATLYFRCFGAIIDPHSTPSVVAGAAASGEHDVHHSNHTVRHSSAQQQQQQCLQQQQPQQHSHHHHHPQFAHHHPHLQTPTKDDGSNRHHLWRTPSRIPSSASCRPTLHIIIGQGNSRRATCNVNETSVNSRFSDSLEMETTTLEDGGDCDRLKSLFEQIPQTTTTTKTQRTRCRRGGAVVLRSALSVTSWWWLTVLAICAASMQPTLAGKGEGCVFPSRWEGSWFLSGNQQPVSIKGSTLSFRGKCIASEGDKFLVVDDKGCHRCLVMYEKHRNVLQYKESECDGDNMYMDQSNPAAMAVQQHQQPLRSVLNSDHRGSAHPNINGGSNNNHNNNHGHSRQSSSSSSSDAYQAMRSSHDEMMANDCNYCKGRETLQTLCEQIAGDALLYSLFKENAEPVKCPLRGPYTFTYNRGHGECVDPVSNIESCTEDSRLLLSFQACPNVSGTESTVEELTCLATWKDGNSRYLVGLVSHHHAISNEERYRCFVYEKILPSNGGNSKDEYKLAQSGDATCNGLDSAEVGSRIMTLRMAPAAERCDFPAWFKGPKHWHALMGNIGYIFHPSDGSLHIAKPNGFMETRALCEQINKQTPTEMMSVVHYTTGCQSGFMCMMFYRRDTHVAEIQMGTPATRLEDACAPDHFDVTKLPYITLLANNPESQVCPLQGLYALRGAVGPPYMSTRHKRNHNNKAHSHHHHASTNGHRRHSTLSFRNSEEFDHGSWRASSRGIPKRNRRETDFTSSDPIIGEPDDDTSDDEPSLSPPSSPPRRPASVMRKRAAAKSIATITTTTTTNDTASSLAQRSRRETPGCIVNYNSQRQLLIGCAQPNLVEVRPQCNEEGDEVYSCHGSWVENDTTFIIARHAGSQHGVCISFLPQEGSAAKLVVGDTCKRSNLPQSDHHLTANLTVFGSCSDPSASNAIAANWILACAVPLVYSIVLRLTSSR